MYWESWFYHFKQGRFTVPIEEKYYVIGSLYKNSLHCLVNRMISETSEYNALFRIKCFLFF